nr:Transmembrane protein [Ipomoea batatas]
MSRVIDEISEQCRGKCAGWKVGEVLGCVAGPAGLATCGSVLCIAGRRNLGASCENDAVIAAVCSRGLLRKVSAFSEVVRICGEEDAGAPYSDGDGVHEGPDGSSLVGGLARGSMGDSIELRLPAWPKVVYSRQDRGTELVCDVAGVEGVIVLCDYCYEQVRCEGETVSIPKLKRWDEVVASVGIDIDAIFDICVAMEEWVDSPRAETALNNVLPCVV